jgi:serine/threonine protein kinase
LTASRSPSRPDQRIVAGRYQLVRKLGAGGMGSVYLARQLNVGNQVALKFLPAQLSDDAQLRRRFEREAALTLQVTHPGAAQLLDAGQDDDGQLFLAFEYVAGDDLSTLLDRDGALPYAEALEITLKVAETLAYAHGKGVVHRDIKPENLRVRRDLAGLHVKVLDFGIARVMDDASTRLTVEGGVAGTPRYMAPEQIGAGTIDGRTDIYALGLVLFEMLTGREAFDRETTSQLMWAQLNDPVPPLRAVQPTRDQPALDAVIATACAKKPEERYGSMRAMVAALRAVPHPHWEAAAPISRRRRTTSPQLDSEPGARDEVLVSRPGRTTMAHRRIGVIGLGVGGIGVALAAVALWVTLGRSPALVASIAWAPTTHTPVAPPVVTVAAKPPAPAPARLATPSTPAPAASSSAGNPVVIGSAGPVIINGVPMQPGVAGHNTQVALAAPQASGDCPSLRMYDPAITKLSVAELEQRALALRYIAPSVAARQLESMKASTANYAPDMRECLYKSTLVTTVLNERTVLQSTPSLWGHTHELAELQRLFMELPLKEDWSAEQRKSVLGQVETLFVANLRKDAPGDGDYWRRMYYGLMITCEATDAALQQVGARRNDGNCPKLRPAG